MPPLDTRDLGGSGTRQWTHEVFRRAYGHPGGPLDRVTRWLRSGFPTLCYLPGSCMAAAVDYIQRAGLGAWPVHGEHAGQGDPLGVWSKAHGLLQAAADGPTPRAIFTNLDRLFLTADNSPTADANAHGVLFSLIESCRRGPTLGLADLKYGRLPDAVEAAFDECIRLDDIDPVRLAEDLVPRELADHLGWDRDHRPGAWQMAARLRWHDPVRAVRLMENACTESNDPAAVLRKIAADCRPSAFEDPDKAFPGDPTALAGVPPATRDLLAAAVVGPYRRWHDLPDLDRRAYDRELRMLPPGVIFHGPPGTGKTYLARWLATSIGLPIRVVAGAELRESRFGNTERNIVRLFQQARRAAPCVLVLDDADDLLPDRATVGGATASADRAIVNTFLQELAGFGGRLPGVLVALTTNRFTDLDAAVRSRIPLHVRVPYPLDREQLGQVIRAVAERYGYDLTAAVAHDLTERLFGPVVLDGDTLRDTPGLRLAADRNLFSPREIEQALLLLRGPDARPTGRYTPTLADVQRMHDYYETLIAYPE